MNEVFFYDTPVPVYPLPTHIDGVSPSAITTSVFYTLTAWENGPQLVYTYTGNLQTVEVHGAALVVTYTVDAITDTTTSEQVPGAVRDVRRPQNSGFFRTRYREPRESGMARAPGVHTTRYSGANSRMHRGAIERIGCGPSGACA